MHGGRAAYMGKCKSTTERRTAWDKGHRMNTHDPSSLVYKYVRLLQTIPLALPHRVVELMPRRAKTSMLLQAAVWHSSCSLHLEATCSSAEQPGPAGGYHEKN